MLYSTVLPILRYGSEVWGYSNMDLIEKKIVEGYHYLYMLYNIILNYWLHIISVTDAKWSCILYKLLHSMHYRNQI